MPIDVPTDLAAARNRVAALTEERRRLVASSARERVRFSDLGRVDTDIADVLERFRGRIDPCDASPQVPLVLLPVRLETKLAPGTSTLRVRITPDELHLDALVRTITPAEHAAGRAYWTTLWADATSTAAWGDLVAAVGARRAGWIAQATMPSNLANRTAATDAPAFPEMPEEVTRGTVARCLPDRFIVRVFPRGGAPITVSGAALARDIPISPVALSNLQDFVAAGNGLTVPAGAEWTVDFAKAKQVGLGIEVQLPAGTQVLDRVVVVGVRGSVSESENAADFADLLLSHRYSDGFGVLAQGTPTNNTEAARSPYKVSATPAAPPMNTGTPSEDLARLASLIGVDAAAVGRLLPPADSPPTLEATQQAANTALWFATWGPVLDEFRDDEIPGITPAQIESARRLHRDHVRGAGPAPVIRVGAQPYGVLPVSDLDAWVPRAGDTTTSLVPLIRRTIGRWVQRARSLPRVRPGDSITDEALVEVLGTSPMGIGIRARPVVDGPTVQPTAAATGTPRAVVDADTLLKRAVLSQYSVEAARIHPPASLHDATRTINLPLVSPRDAEVVAAILAGQEPKVDSVLQALLDVAWDNVKQKRIGVAPEQFVPPLLDLLGLSDEITQMVRETASQPDGIAGRSTRFFAAAETVRAVQHFERQPVEQLSIAAIEPVREAQTSLAQVALDLGDTVQAKWIGSQAIAGLLDWYGVRGEVRAAMVALGAAPSEERRIAVAHALDVASHRVDAWATGLASSRRETLAAANPTGMTLGAFGYVEDVVLSPQRDAPDGWIHAPSTAHAVTAGVLASAHRSNIGAQPGKFPFAIDLSSRRGAELRRVLEGVQAGQSIGALLGYQIERGIAGTSAARFQLSLRQLAPMATDELGNELAAVDGDALRAQARAAVADVFDGLTLLRLHPVASLRVANPALRSALAKTPENLFLPGPWPPPTDDEWNAIVTAMDAAAATLDVVADALLSESVLQYASGNAARASAAMNAMGSGAGVDPALDVLDVRQPTKRLSHGAFAVIPADTAGWSNTRPRAVAEPRLEAWAARRLGDSASIVVAEVAGKRHTLAEAGLAALDFVFAADAATLERELRTAIPALGVTALASVRDAAWPAGTQPVLQALVLARTLRTLIAKSTSISPASLVRPGASPQRRVDTDEILARVDRLVAAFQAALDAGGDVIGALDPSTLAVAPAAAPSIAAAVAPLAAFGIQLAPEGDPKAVGNVAWAWGAWNSASARLDQGRATLAALRAPRVAPAAPPGAEEVMDACQRVADIVLGDGFRLLPLLVPLDTVGVGATEERDAFAQAVRTPAFAQPPLSKINAFVRDHATVLEGVAVLSEAQLLGGALGRAIRLSVVQLTERDGDTPAPGTDRWLAGPLADDVPWPDSTAAHLVVELPENTADVEGPFAGLAVDAWIEAVPFQPDRKALDPAAPENPLLNARATTGLAVHANQASARAPQVVLSAVSPDHQRWTTDSVVQTVIEAIDLSKARMVTLEHVPGDAALLPAIYIASPWLQARRGFSFAELALVGWNPKYVPFLSEVK